jgi:hypothetical protein
MACFALLTASATFTQAQYWVRESTVLPEALTGGGSHSGSGGTFDITTAVYGGLEFNDNVGLTSSGESGLAVRAGVNAGIRYPISEKNELTFDASLERLTYISGISGTADYDSILPGTATTFTIFTGHIRIRNFLQLRLTEDPVSNPVINNTSRFGRLNADVGTQMDWDMNRVIWQLTGSVGRQLATESVNEQIDHWRYAVGLRSVFPLGPGTAVGVSTSYAITSYDLSIQNNSATRSAGVFGQHSLSRNISVEASAGLQRVDYEQGGAVLDTTDYNGLYGAFSFAHQVRRTISYTLTARHDTDEGYGTNFYRITEIILSPRVMVLKKWELVGNASWQWIDESGPTGENATRLYLGLEARRALGRKLDGAAGVGHTQKFSDQAGGDYSQNRIFCSVRYTF